MDRDAYSSAGLHDPAGHLDVGARGAGASAWMVVHKAAGRGGKLKGAAHHLARIDRRVIDRTFTRQLVGDQLIGLVQELSDLRNVL